MSTKVKAKASPKSTPKKTAAKSAAASKRASSAPTTAKLKTHTIKNVKGTRKGTEDDVALIRNNDWRDSVDADELRVHEGDLAIAGHYAGDDGRLLVRGNVTVTGTVSLDETGTLIVTGNLHCKNLHCEGDLEVQGDVLVDETIFGFYEAGITFFHKKVKAKLMLEGNHSFEYSKKKLEADAHIQFDNYSPMKKAKRELARTVLSDEAIKALGSLIGLVEGDDDADEDDAWTPRLLSTKGFLR